MARPRQIPSTPQLTPGQATYIVDKLISERRLSPGEVSRYIGDMQREIGDLERRLEALRAATGSAGPARRGRRPGRPPRQAAAGTQEAEAAGSAKRGAKRGRRARRALSGAQLTSRQLQGRYLGLIRQIPATRRGQYKRIAAEKGREAAIKEMLDVLKK